MNLICENIFQIPKKIKSFIIKNYISKIEKIIQIYHFSNRKNEKNEIFINKRINNLLDFISDDKFIHEIVRDNLHNLIS